MKVDTMKKDFDIGECEQFVISKKYTSIQN